MNTMREIHERRRENAMPTQENTTVAQGPVQWGSNRAARWPHSRSSSLHLRPVSQD